MRHAALMLPCPLCWHFLGSAGVRVLKVKSTWHLFIVSAVDVHMAVVADMVHLRFSVCTSSVCQMLKLERWSVCHAAPVVSYCQNFLYCTFVDQGRLRSFIFWSPPPFDLGYVDILLTVSGCIICVDDKWMWIMWIQNQSKVLCQIQRTTNQVGYVRANYPKSALFIMHRITNLFKCIICT